MRTCGGDSWRPLDTASCGDEFLHSSIEFKCKKYSCINTMGATHDHLRRKGCLKMEQKVILVGFKPASDSPRCFRLTDETKDVILQVFHHHLSPGEVTKGVRSIVGVSFPLSAPRPHTHFIQDVLQLYFTANIWRKRRGGDSQRRNSFWACGWSTL